MNLFLVLLGVSCVLLGLGLLLSLTIRALAHYRQYLDEPKDEWADWDAYQGKDPQVAAAKARWEGKPQKKAKKKG